MSFLEFTKMLRSRLKDSSEPIIFDMTPTMVQDLINLVAGKVDKITLPTKDGRTLVISWKDER